MTVVRMCDSHQGGVKGEMVMWEVLRDVEWCDTCPYIEGLFESLGKCEFKTFLTVFLSARFYQKIQQTMKIEKNSRKSKVFGAPCVFLKFLESARFGRYWPHEYSRMYLKFQADS